MITITTLWAAILLSAVFAWIMSALVWMVLPHHKKDFQPLPDEAAAVEVLRPQKLKPGQYNIPHCADMAEFKTPQAQARFDQGPVGFLTVVDNGMPSMGKMLVSQFVYFLVVGVVIAYLASRMLEPGEDYLSVFRLTATVAFAAYGLGSVPDAIWFGRPWSAIAKNAFDALLYALVTGGVFGWLWPA